MNTTFEQTGTQAKSVPRTDWGYISGRLSVLETLLLSRSFFEGILKAHDLSEVRSALAKTPYRAVFTTDEAIRNYHAVLDKYSEAIISDIYGNSPPHVLKSFFDIMSRYPVFRGIFLRAVARGASLSEIDSSFDTLTSTEEEQEALLLHRSMLRDRETPQHADAVARSLFLDSVFCTLRLKLAGKAPEELVTSLLRDIAALQCWSAVLRSRWNGTSSEVIRRWFVLPDISGDMVKDTTALAESNPAGALTERISEHALQIVKEAGHERIRRNVDNVAGEAIREGALQCRMVPYGPEKVLGYVVAFQVEQENLRLALSSVVSRVAPQIVAERFRREYA
jgi:vacuolar-type H+-ATPase subunit C/Vma6